MAELTEEANSTGLVFRTLTQFFCNNDKSNDNNNNN